MFQCCRQIPRKRAEELRFALAGRWTPQPLSCPFAADQGTGLLKPLVREEERAQKRRGALGIAPLKSVGRSSTKKKFDLHEARRAFSRRAPPSFLSFFLCLSLRLRLSPSLSLSLSLYFRSLNAPLFPRYKNNTRKKQPPTATAASSPRQAVRLLPPLPLPPLPLPPQPPSTLPLLPLPSPPSPSSSSPRPRPRWPPSSSSTRPSPRPTTRRRRRARPPRPPRPRASPRPRRSPKRSRRSSAPPRARSPPSTLWATPPTASAPSPARR